MDFNLLVISIVGLAIGVVCLGVGVWFFRKKIVTVLEKVPLLAPTEEPEPDRTLVDLTIRLRQFEEKTA